MGFQLDRQKYLSTHEIGTSRKLGCFEGAYSS